MKSSGMSEQQVAKVWVGYRAGDSLSRIDRREGVALQHVRRFLNQHGGVRPSPAVSPVVAAVDRRAAGGDLAWSLQGESFRVIAARLGCAHTTGGFQRSSQHGSGRQVDQLSPPGLAVTGCRQTRCGWGPLVGVGCPVPAG